MRRADRLFELVQLLRGKRVVTAQALAETLEVSVRTIYRDIRDLQSTGVPIDGEAGVGYSLQKGYELPPLTFNTDELEALVFGARVVSVWGDPAMAAAARRLLSKVEAVLPESLKGTMNATQIFANPTQPSTPTHLALLRQAVASKQKVEIHYKKPNDATQKRTISPLGLYFWGRVWVLASWCELRQSYRAFRIDRILTAELLPRSFEAEPISLEAFLQVQKDKGSKTSPIDDQKGHEHHPEPKGKEQLDPIGERREG